MSGWWDFNKIDPTTFDEDVYHQNGWIWLVFVSVFAFCVAATQVRFTCGNTSLFQKVVVNPLEQNSQDLSGCDMM